MKAKILHIVLLVSLMIPVLPVHASEIQENQMEQVEEMEEVSAESSEALDEELSVGEEAVEPVQESDMSPATTQTEEIVEEVVVEEDEILGAKVIEGNYSVDKNWTLDRDYVINGDLYLRNGYSISLGNHQLTVNGGVYIVDGSFYGNKGTLNVKGNLWVRDGYFFVEETTINIAGDFGIYNINEDGDKITCDSRLLMCDASGRLNVGGDFLFMGESYYEEGVTLYDSGTISVKGDFTWVPDGYLDLGEVKLILNGNGPQKVTLHKYDRDSNIRYNTNAIKYLQIDNPNVTISGMLDWTDLQSDATIKVGEDGLILRYMDLQGHKLTIYGDVIVDETMDTGEMGSRLIVKGDYIQTEGTLYVGSGTVDISGSLYLQGRDADGNATNSYSSINMGETNGNLNIGKDLVLQTSSKGTFEYGILTLKGNLIQLSDAVNIVGEYGHRVVLAGNGPQKISFINKNNTFNILELKKPLHEYSFSPARCWKTLAGVYEWPFKDLAIRDGYWKYESVKYVYENNIMSGVGDGKRFNPDGTMTRAMFATVIYRMAGNPQVNYEPIFTDVPAGKWYSDAIVWAYRRGIVNGYPDGRFGHGDSITREQMAKMLKGYADVQQYNTYQRGKLTSFTDAKKVSGWAEEYMKWAVGSGMISGKENAGKKYLDPKGNATRVECATMLKRFIEKYQ